MRWSGFSSLTTRLGLLFALAAILTFVGVGLYLYQSLAQQLEIRDDVELIGKIGQVRHLLQETSSLAEITENPHRFIDAAAGHAGLIVILKAPNGTILFQNHDDHIGLPVLSVTPADQTPEPRSIGQWNLQTGTTARAVAALGMLADTRQQAHIIVARTSTDRLTLLAAFRNQVLISILSGALLAALSGYLLVRRGLRPVRAIARQAQLITAQQLDRRLDATAAPNELRILIQAFNEMLDRLHASFQRLSQFSADLAHDMRTPLNNLMVQTQVALSHPREPDDYLALLASNVEEYERLARMVESMLFLARADHAEVEIVKQRLEPFDELRRIAEYFEGVADDAQVRFQVSASGPFEFEADPILFRRAVNNLVANAVHHSPSGGVITLSAQPWPGATVITVSNPGNGIDPQHLPRLFDRFYRVDQARTNSAHSAGLGLAIVQSIMALHGGRAEVESIPHEITTFRLIFPSLK